MPEAKGASLPSARMQTLFDGISSIAMTLLVMNIQVPDSAAAMNNAELITLLASMTPRFFVFILSFLLLASLWRIHHRQYQWIDNLDGSLLWINIFWQLFIALLPFSASLIGQYGNHTASAFVFHGNLLAIGLCSWLSWYYAVKNRLTSPATSAQEIRNNLYSVLILPTVALIALIAGFWIPGSSSQIYLLIIPFRLMLNKIILSKQG